MTQQEAHKGPINEQQRDKERQILRPCVLEGFEDARDVLDLLLNGHMDVGDQLGLVLRAQWLDQILVIEL